MEIYNNQISIRLDKLKDYQLSITVDTRERESTLTQFSVKKTASSEEGDEGSGWGWGWDWGRAEDDEARSLWF